MPESAKVRVEIPKGSRNKYEYNQETGDLELDRRLHAAVTYPTEYGYVEETETEEGEELDAMVAVTEPTFPGCVIHARPIALLEMYKGDTPNHKVLGVPLEDPAWNDLDGADDLPGDLADEITHFFRSYNELEGGDWRIEGWASAERAWEEIESCRKRFTAS